MSKAKLYTYNGKTLTLSEWARLAGIGRQTLRQRLYIGWDFGRAVSTPNLNYRYEIDGRKYTISEISQMNRRVSKAAMRQRINQLGMSVRDAIRTPNLKVRNTDSLCSVPCEKCPYPDCIK